jgi:histidyl-tRNA synthetase
MASQHSFQSPKGTRDFYPVDAARRRFILESWRTASVRHGFDEIDGPTFEHLDLYTVKSGDGIVSELFSFRRDGGEKDYALRPEFTPTLARMYAAKASTLPKPTKWFMAGPFFRAERPQRGRLREFLQWNVDHLGDENRTRADGEVIACCVDLLASLGLTSEGVKVRINDRAAMVKVFDAAGLPPERRDAMFSLLDRKAKMTPEQFGVECGGVGASAALREFVMGDVSGTGELGSVWRESFPLLAELPGSGVDMGWIAPDHGVVRGLAYYTGMVFEVIVDGERAVAGGGRYDNLVELFGGPSTPAVGFGMGDIVLALVLQDKGLMPTDAELLARCGQRPDVFVIANPARGSDDAAVALAESAVRPLLASLRTAGLHARQSYKSTKNVGKLLQEAAASGAAIAALVEGPASVVLKDMATGAQDQTGITLAGVAAEVRKRLARS